LCQLSPACGAAGDAGRTERAHEAGAIRHGAKWVNYARSNATDHRGQPLAARTRLERTRGHALRALDTGLPAAVGTYAIAIEIFRSARGDSYA
jgi:hypothetical protein